LSYELDGNFDGREEAKHSAQGQLTLLKDFLANLDQSIVQFIIIGLDGHGLS
jgi:hypothetical protein